MSNINQLFKNFNGNIVDIKEMYYLCKDFITKQDNKEREEKVKNKIKCYEKLDKITIDDIKCYERKYKYINFQIEKHIQFNIKNIKVEIIYSGDTELNGTYNLSIGNIEICNESKELTEEEIKKNIIEELDEDDIWELKSMLNENNIEIDDLCYFVDKIFSYL